VNFLSLLKRNFIYKIKSKKNIDHDTFEKDVTLDNLFEFYKTDKASNINSNDQLGHGYSSFYHKHFNELQSKKTYEAISKMIKKDLSNSYVRIEVICDREGFWLKPHCDIKEKLMSGLIFINKTDESVELGTDFYNEKLEKVKTVPFKHNYGYLFTSGPNTWHGMEKKKIIKERRCVQVNYVTFETDWKVNT